MPPARRLALTGAGRAVLLSVLLVLTPLVLPATANASDRLHDRTGTGAVWTAATVVSDGAPVVSGLQVEEIALPLHLGARLYDDQRRLVGSTNATLRSPEEGVLVHSEPTPGLGITVDELEQAEAGRLRDVQGSLTLNPAAPTHVGRYTLVLWIVSADVDRWTWSVDGAGADLLGTTSGGRLFLATSRDFDAGPVNLAGGAYVGGASMQARVQAGSRYTRRALGTLVGSYYPVLSSADTLTVSTPRGERQCVPDCQFGDVEGPASLPAGTYEFRLTGAGAGGAAGRSAGDVVAVGAELVLPAAA